MSVDEAIENVINQFLTTRGYVTKESAGEIAREISQKFYEQFQVDITELKTDVNKISERGDKMWDLIHKAPTPSWFSRVWHRIWGKKGK